MTAPSGAVYFIGNSYLASRGPGFLNRDRPLADTTGGPNAGSLIAALSSALAKSTILTSQRFWPVGLHKPGISEPSSS